jgi:hypothetical protein
MIDPRWKRQLKDMIRRDDVTMQEIGDVALRNAELADALNRYKMSAAIGDRTIRDLQHLLSLIGTGWILNWIAQQEARERRESDVRAA